VFLSAPTYIIGVVLPVSGGNRLTTMPMAHEMNAVIVDYFTKPN